MTQSNDHRNSRIHYLDSIRGIAAMMVVVMHFIGWRWGETIQFKLASFVFNGTEAVSFFFVLSGFVLSYSYINSSRKIEPFRYLYKRVLRLYPAYIVTILLLFIYFRGPLSFESMFVTFETTLPYKELLMFQRTHDLYLPGWTLRIEIIYSVLILGLIYLCRKSPYLLLIPLIACYFIGPPDTRIYMNHFILGMVLSLVYPSIKNMSTKEAGLFNWQWPIYLGIFLMFSIPQIAKLYSPIQKLLDFLWTYDIRGAHFSGLAAFMFMIMVMLDKKLQTLLESKALLYLGKISYSIYLVHWGFCMVIMSNWEALGTFLGEGALRFSVMFVTYIVVTIIAAELLYRFVEKPFIGLSRGK